MLQAALSDCQFLDQHSSSQGSRRPNKGYRLVKIDTILLPLSLKYSNHPIDCLIISHLPEGGGEQGRQDNAKPG